PGEAPTVLAPPALALRAAIADDRVPVAISFFLIVRGDLEGKGFALFELRPAVEAEAGNAENGKLDRQHVAHLTARVVRRGVVNCRHLSVRKGRGVETRGVLGVFVEPEANRVFGCQGCSSPFR